MAFTSTKEYPHGTNARWTLNGCKCADCARAHAAYEAERRFVQRLIVALGLSEAEHSDEAPR